MAYSHGYVVALPWLCGRFLLVDYLQYVTLWVQISKIPVNHYTKVALTALGDLVGKTIVVAYDPTKPITQPFVRV